jgi:ATP-dependent Lon protease
MEMRRRVKEQLKKMAGLEYWDVNFSYIDRESGQQTFVPVPETGGGQIIMPGEMSPGSVYTIGKDVDTGKLALFLLQAQVSAGSGRIIPLGNLSRTMKEGIKTAEAYLKANLKNLGIMRDWKSYDFSLQAINLNQAKEGAETAVAFFICLVSALLEQPVRERLVVLGEMSVQGLLLRISNLTERMELALDSGARWILVPSENKRELADVPDGVLNKLQPIFYTDPLNAAIRAMGLD